jgi:hypothetical protein
MKIADGHPMRRGCWFAALFGGVFALFAFASSSNAATIFNDFGPGDSFNTNTGWGVSTASSCCGLHNAAMAFTSPIDADLAQIDIAIQHAQGSANSGTTLTLYTKVGNNLGSPIASWVLGALPAFGTAGAPGITTITGITGVHLTAGNSFFLLAEAAGDDFNSWMTNDQSVFGITIIEDSALPRLLGAFRLLSEPTVIPLPAALPLFAGGLGVIALLAHRRKQRHAAQLH